MRTEKVYLGKNELNPAQAEVSGRFVEIDGELFYQIKNCHEMPDFFISIVSDSDHWMFISSNGSLTAGRRNRDNALFPYYTEDKIHDYKNITGSSSYFLVGKDDKTFLWAPFTDESKNSYPFTRNLYKSIYGNKIIFEEVNVQLGLSFRYGWYNSEKFGFVKKSCLINHGTDPSINIRVMDGIRNILPNGIGYGFQSEYSNLLDAYKKNERIEGSTLGLFMLSSIPVDRAEPSEALKTTTVWSVGFGGESKILVSDRQINAFKNGLSVESEVDIRAARGAYFINAQIELATGSKKEWFTIAEVNQDSTDVANLSQFIQNTLNPEDLITNDINQGTVNLKKMVSFADGFQMTNTNLCYARHFTNTLFNIMRGGVFTDNYFVQKADFKLYLSQINKPVARAFQPWLESLPDKITYPVLTILAEETANADLIRITNEYLPLTFSRRHGDPSRPWNQFSIETRNDDGTIKYDYQGNWRDIFQNWEALCFSYPEFIEGIISKFVNATTIDGYNPYRIMRAGIDWESPDPDDAWSYIGYWGDHQIIYLQKLLELSDKFHPGKLDTLLTTEVFAYANVPYRIKPYSEIVRNPKDTVVFDEKLNKRINTLEATVGADAKLLHNQAGDQIYKANLTEKILVTLLSKLSNFIPEAGIWLNTQRPEWNDANNALVGNGTSMVTLYYLRRFLKFWNEKFSNISITEISVSEEIAVLFDNMLNFFDQNISVIEKGFTDADRRKFADFLGQAHADYRNKIYVNSFSGKKIQLPVKDLVSFTSLCLRYVDQSIKVNKREDGLYHAYNLISWEENKVSIRHLYEMLEGQVAVLSSGLLSGTESLDVLDALKRSKIFRPDQYSYMLYPDRQLPRFNEKNVIPKDFVNKSSLLKKLLEDKDTTIISQDNEGNYHFNSEFRNGQFLETSLNKLSAESYRQLVDEEKEKILGIYEAIFDHQSFTGRSGTFYGYEGLGSIYWHMVSKLLLATQECFFKAIDEGADGWIVGRLNDHYYEIKAGIGLYKSPQLYGAFPTDAYSHTPANSGVKQPGLTGQVKEDVISRIGEMGVRINDGKIMFETSLLNKEEILDKSQVFEYYRVNGEKHEILLSENQISFTFCQVPVVYTFSDEEKIAVAFENGKAEIIPGNLLNSEISNMIFNRSGEVKLIEVTLKSNHHVG
jgi:hypothetical protein